jgi:hypothetical protein
MSDPAVGERWIRILKESVLYVRYADPDAAFKSDSGIINDLLRTWSEAGDIKLDGDQVSFPDITEEHTEAIIRGLWKLRD